MRTNGLGYLLGLLCVVSDIALSDLDAILSDLSVPVPSFILSSIQAYRVEELRGAPLVDGKVAALLESRLSDRSALEVCISFLNTPLPGRTWELLMDVRMRP